ncbi:hypothetical protein SAMN05428988_4257 [Chitinophaga sp. YR573]|nr:hypothetical protein SAMN05428988_4257 [Chitinophaga sp. YR573]
MELMQDLKVLILDLKKVNKNAGFKLNPAKV